MRGYKTQNNNTSFDRNVNMEQNGNQSDQNNTVGFPPKPTNLKVLIIATIVVVVGMGLAIAIHFVLLGSFFDSTKGSENGHNWIDLGLPSGIKWATTNVGANAPEEFGDYFAWGETSPKSMYDWSTYKWCRGSHDTPTKYIVDSYCGTVDNKTTLDSSDDAVHEIWGGNWRMPTKEEIEELRDNCDWSSTTMKGVEGMIVRSRINNNYIFLPAAGNRTNSGFYDVSAYGYYWSSSAAESSYSDVAYVLDWDPSDVIGISGSGRSEGLSVRAVCP